MKYNLSSILMTSIQWAFSSFLPFAVLTSFIASSPPAFADDDAEIRSHINRGNALLGRRQFQEAISEYEAVLKIQPNYPVAKSNIALTHNNWGIYLYGLRRYAEAKEHWETALKLNPSDGHVIRNLKILEAAMQRNPPPPAPRAESDGIEGWSPFDALEREAEQKKAAAAATATAAGTAGGSGASVGSSGGTSNGSGGNSGSGTAGVFGTGFGGSGAAGSTTGNGAFGGTAGGSTTSFGNTNAGSNQTATSEASKTDAPPTVVILSNTNAGISTSSATAATSAGTSSPSTSDGTSASPFSRPATITGSSTISNASNDTNVNFGTDPFQPREQNPAPSVRIVGGSMGGATIVGGSTVASGGKSFTPSAPVTANMPSNTPIAPVRIPAKPASGSVPMSWPGADENSKNEESSSKPKKKSDSSKKRAQSGSDGGADDQDSENIEDLLAKIENKVYGKISKNTPILKRLEKLEVDTSGKKNSGSVAERLKELKDAYGI